MEQLDGPNERSVTPLGPDQEDANLDPTKRRRNRKAVTCAQCRKRKLKCDRGAPCGACKDRNEACDWGGAVRLPHSTYTSSQEAAELRTQLDRLEIILLTHQSNQSHSSNSNEDYSSGMSLLGHGRSALGLRPADFEDSGRASAVEALSMLATTSNSSNRASSAPSSSHGRPVVPLFYPLPSPPLESLLASLPPRAELERILDAFLYAPPLPILHAPSFKERYRAFEWERERSGVLRSGEGPFFVALLLSIVGYNTFWRATDPRMVRIASGSGRPVTGSSNGSTSSSVTATVWFQAAMSALHLGSYLENHSLDSIRVLLLLREYYRATESTEASIMGDLAVRIARGIGLNRDPGRYKRYSITEQEERRRIHALLLVGDWTESPGRTYNCSVKQYDTQLPANASDDAVTEEGILARPLHLPTPILELLYTFQIATLARQITDSAYAIAPLPSWTTLMDLHMDLSHFDAALPACFAFEWEAGAVKRFGREEADHGLEMMRVNVQLALRGLFVRLHRPFLTRGCADSRFALGREKCCWAARYILAIHRGLGEDFRATRSWSITFHALNALCILAIDLYQDPCGSLSEIHQTDISSSLRLFEARPHKSQAVRETMRVVGVLLRRSMMVPQVGGMNDGVKKRKFEEGGIGGLAGRFGSRSPGAGASDLSFILEGGQAGAGPGDPRTSEPQKPSPRSFTYDLSKPFSRPLPLSMSVDPFAPRPPLSSVPTLEMEFSQLWRGLTSLSLGMYAVPDAEEWLNIASGRPWSGGIDLLQ